MKPLVPYGMRRWVALLAIVITACSQPSGHPLTQASVSPSERLSSAPTVTPSTSPTQPVSPTTAGVPLLDPPLSKASFSCRLPIYKIDALTSDSFITFPSAEVSLVPNSHGKYYDRQFSRWLPVSVREVYPDGSRYAYIESAETEFVIHVVAVDGGKETLVHLSNQLFNGQPMIFDYSADGIYLVQAFEHLLPGLWLVDPVTGSIRQIAKDIYPAFSAGSGIVWTQAVNPADPNPVVTGTSLGTLPDEIDRFDMRSGELTEWLYEPGKGLGINGVDSRGLPLIDEVGFWGADTNAKMLLVAAPDTPRLIYKGAIVEAIGGGITDSHGIWLSGQRGIYLYNNAGALEKVSDHPGIPANGCF